MVRPLTVIVDNERVQGFTDLKLSRKKEDLTGELDINLFLGHIPEAPVLPKIIRGEQILVYIGEHLAFTGTIDSRTGKGTPGRNASGQFTSGSAALPATASVAGGQYSMRVKARGLSKVLVDASHQHPTTNLETPTNRSLVSTLLAPFNITVEWLADEFELDTIRLRDGIAVVQELERIASENGHFIYETRDGKVRVTDNVGPDSGEALILGDNILSFSASQSETKAKSHIKVKGQRSKRGVWGKDAVVDKVALVEDTWVGQFRPLIVEHYGDATDAALQRRAKFEMDVRSSKSKVVEIDVFHVQSRDGTPWDVGTLHYVEIPPEGIATVMECTGVKYNVDAQGTLTTSLTLSPPPADATTTNLDTLNDPAFRRRTALNRPGSAIPIAPDGYPDVWTGPIPIIRSASTFVQSLSDFIDGIPDALNDPRRAIGRALFGTQSNPPLTLPAHLQDDPEGFGDDQRQ